MCLYACCYIYESDSIHCWCFSQIPFFFFFTLGKQKTAYGLCVLRKPDQTLSDSSDLCFGAASAPKNQFLDDKISRPVISVDSASTRMIRTRYHPTPYSFPGNSGNYRWFLAISYGSFFQRGNFWLYSTTSDKKKKIALNSHWSTHALLCQMWLTSLHHCTHSPFFIDVLHMVYSGLHCHCCCCLSVPFKEFKGLFRYTYVLRQTGQCSVWLYVDGCAMKSIEIISTYVHYDTYYVVMYIMQWYEIEEKTFSKVFFLKGN